MSASLSTERITPCALRTSRVRDDHRPGERASLGPRLRSGSLSTEPAVACVRVQAGELALAHVHKRLMISSFEVEIRLLLDALVNDHVEPIARAHGRDRATRAVVEHRRNFALVGQGHGLTDLLFQVREPDPASGWNDSQPIGSGIAEQDTLGQAITGDVACLSRVQGRLSRWVWDEIVGDLV